MGRRLAGRTLAILAFLGRSARSNLRFLLMMVGGCWGIVRESLRPSAWRRTTRGEFRRTLRHAAGGGVVSTLFTATLVGFAVIWQAIYWLGIAGLTAISGSLLVTVLLRELAPILVGIILLGRSGMPMIAELGQRVVAGQIRALEAQGIDPFVAIVMPRVLALTVSGFTLGIVFALAALVVGFAVASTTGALSGSLWGFLGQVTGAMRRADYLAIPADLMLVGFLVALSCCLTGLSAHGEAERLALLSRGFGRGILTIMVANILFSLSP